jgi:carbon storage regulator
MLVLSRKESQRIRLGDAIVVTIVKISGDKVRVGIEAPSDVLVLRDELEPRTAPSAGAMPAPPADSSAQDQAAPLRRSA